MRRLTALSQGDDLIWDRFCFCAAGRAWGASAQCMLQSKACRAGPRGSRRATGARAPGRGLCVLAQWPGAGRAQDRKSKHQSVCVWSWGHSGGGTGRAKHTPSEMRQGKLNVCERARPKLPFQRFLPRGNRSWPLPAELPYSAPGSAAVDGRGWLAHQLGQNVTVTTSPSWAAK